MIDDDPNRYSDELQIFHDVAKALTSSLDLDNVLETILEKIAAYFKPDSWSLMMLDEQTQELYCTVAIGKDWDSVNALKLTTGESLARWVIERGTSLVITDITKDERID